ncbi:MULTISPECIES: hypothetical protein [unclassified Rhizobium]|uniref:hypothetical protein n=1 Tax=unclassified Rhizobium TaxID=2613769 RepID=UPI001675B093|nr:MULTISPECIES: hypothetical protein [unclassified Rhizobium]
MTEATKARKKSTARFKPMPRTSSVASSADFRHTPSRRIVKKAFHVNSNRTVSPENAVRSSIDPSLALPIKNLATS